MKHLSFTKRAKIAREVYEELYLATDSFYPFSCALGYLLGAILTDNQFDFTRHTRGDKALLRKLKEVFKPKHEVWQFTRCLEERTS
jgi:hypothetical protein